MARLFLIRHGRPSAVWGGADEDPGLDATGHAQATQAAQALLGLPEGERPLAVASSPLKRCLETAAPVARLMGVEVELVPAVGEIPTPAGLSASARGPWLRGALAGLWSQIEGDLDYAQWRRDIAQAVAARPRTAIFSHFVAINALVGELNGGDEVIAFRPDHASITTLDLGSAGLKLVELGREAQTGVL
jgi:broad specificity phosphatase PhoE